MEELNITQLQSITWWRAATAPNRAILSSLEQTSYFDMFEADIASRPDTSTTS